LIANGSLIFPASHSAAAISIPPVPSAYEPAASVHEC
jgi:hypothetical protein